MSAVPRQRLLAKIRILSRCWKPRDAKMMRVPTTISLRPGRLAATRAAGRLGDTASDEHSNPPMTATDFPAWLVEPVGTYSLLFGSVVDAARRGYVQHVQLSFVEEVGRRGRGPERRKPTRSGSSRAQCYLQFHRCAQKQQNMIARWAKNRCRNDDDSRR